MSSTATINSNSLKPSEAKSISIEIEPSYPLIVAMTEFFRVQRKPKKALELCQTGLDYFPGDLGLRLGLAMSYLDMSEKDKASTEIMTVVQELIQLAPVLDSLAKTFHQHEQKELGEWFHQLFLILSSPPGKNFETKEDPPVSSLFPEEEFQTKEDHTFQENLIQAESAAPSSSLNVPEWQSPLTQENATGEKGKFRDFPESNILSTLTGWLSQLKESKA